MLKFPGLVWGLESGWVISINRFMISRLKILKILIRKFKWKYLVLEILRREKNIEFPFDRKVEIGR